MRQPKGGSAAERGLVGAMLLSKDVIDEVAEILGSVEPYDPKNAAVFRVIMGLRAAGEPVDETTVLHRLMEASEAGRIGGGNYLHTLMQAAPNAGSATFFARELVEEDAQRKLFRWIGELQEIAGYADPAVRNQRVVDVAGELRRLAASGGSPAVPPRATPLDWATFLTREQGPVDFLAGRLMVRGQQIALVGHGKAGKSLLSVEWAWRISAGLAFLGDGPRPPLRVLYVDQENPDDDIQERLLSLGATAETLQNLTYLSFPVFRPLNTEAGAGDFLTAVDAYRPAVVFLDTVSRMVKGEENAADTWLALYRLTLMPLKARGISSVRLDHFGKDATRGSRGNSAKTQDVDAVWELAPVEGDATLLQLTRTHTRNGKGADDLLLRRHGELIGDRWKTGGTWHGVADESERPSSTPDPGQQYRPAARRVLGVLAGAAGPLTVRHIGDELAAQSSGPLKPRTIQDALRTLAEAGEADECEITAGKPSLWIRAVRADS